MKHIQKLFAATVLLAAGTALVAGPEFAAKETRQMPGMNQDRADEVTPAFHPQPPEDKLPATLEPSLFSEKLIFNAYAVAGRVEKVLYQQPCYCHCDRSQGHGSLLDCFVSHHGSGCDICQKEVFFSYEQTRKGKTPAQIREAITRGDWQKVDLLKYQAAYLPPAAK